MYIYIYTYDCRARACAERVFVSQTGIRLELTVGQQPTYIDYTIIYSTIIRYAIVNYYILLYYIVHLRIRRRGSQPLQGSVVRMAPQASPLHDTNNDDHSYAIYIYIYTHTQYYETIANHDNIIAP